MKISKIHKILSCLLLLASGNLLFAQSAKLQINSSIITPAPACGSDIRTARDEVVVKAPADGSSVFLRSCTSASNNVVLKTDYTYTPKMELIPAAGAANGNDSYQSKITSPSAVNTSGQVAYIKGSAAVSPSGGGSYTIPISLPAGPKGIMPQLALAYSTQQGNGIAGWGWDLSGLSAISRSVQSIGIDKQTRAVDMTTSDKFAINGNRMLLKSGTYGGNASVYRTYNENFVDITYNASVGDYFSMTTQEGSVIEFGNSTDSKTYPLKGAINHTVPYAWNISKATDPNGNQINYQYINAGGASRLSKISYGVGSGAVEILLIYSSKEDKTKMYVTQSAEEDVTINQSDLLSQILVNVGGQFYTQYELEYTYYDTKSKLQKVKQKDSKGKNINPTEIIWNEATSAIAMEQDDLVVGLPTNLGGTADAIYYGYFNDDRLIDMLQLRSNTSSFAFENSKVLALFFQNTAGKFVYQNNHEVSYDQKGTNNTSNTTATNCIGRFVYNVTLNDTKFFSGIVIADKNNDGIDEVYVQGLRNYYYYTFTKNGTPTECNLLNITAVEYRLKYSQHTICKLNTMSNFNFCEETLYDSGRIPNTEYEPYSSFIHADINGDGENEMLLFREGKVVYSSNPSVLAEGTVLPNAPKNLFAMDKDGDGKAELFGQLGSSLFPDFTQTGYRQINGKSFYEFTVKDPTLGVLKTYKYSGNTFVLDQDDLTVNSTGNIKPIFGDFNADGKIDFLSMLNSYTSENYVKYSDFKGSLCTAGRGGSCQFINMNKTIRFFSQGGPLNFTRTGNVSLNTLQYYNPANILTSIPNGNTILTIGNFHNNSPTIYYNLPNSFTHKDSLFTERTYNYDWKFAFSNGSKFVLNTEYGNTIKSALGLTNLQAKFGVSDDKVHLDNMDAANSVFGTLIGQLSNDYFTAADFNGDGYSDIIRFKYVRYDKQNVTFYINNKTGFDVYTQEITASLDYSTIAITDFDQDGKPDVAFLNKRSYRVAHIYFDKNSKANYVKSITDGLGRTAEFQIENIKANSAFYSESTTAPAGGNLRLRPGMAVVTKLKQPDGIGGIAETNYKYKDGLINTQGFGFLGFASFEISNNSNSNRIVTNFEFAYNALRVKNSQNYKGSVLLGETVLTNLASALSYTNSFSSIFNYVDQKTDYDYLTNTRTLTTYTYDGNTGELTGSTTNVGDLTTFSANTTEGFVYQTINGKRKLQTHTASAQTGTAAATLHSTTYEYNGTNNNVSKETFDDGTANKTTTTYDSYDSFGNVLSMSKTGAGQTFTNSYTYDPSGRFMLSQTQHGGYTSKYQYNYLLGTLEYSEDAFGNSIRTEYDGLGTALKTTDQKGNTVSTQMAWDINTTNKTVYKITKRATGAADQVTYFDVLERGIKSETSVFAGAATTQITLIANKTYKADGSIDFETKPHTSSDNIADYKVTYTYTSDGTNRIQTVTEKGFIVTYTYDGLKTTVTDHRGRTTENTTNRLGFLTQVKDHNNKLITFSNFDNGGKARTINANGYNVTMAFDDYGRRTSITDLASGTIAFQYDALGRQTSTTDANSKTINYTYDSEGRIADKIIAGADGYTITHSYVQAGAAKGKIETITHNTASDPRTQTFEYDSEGRLTSHSQQYKAGGQTKNLNTSYTYDNQNRITTRTYPSGVKLLYSYDQATGSLYKVTKDDNTLVWEITEQNKHGQPVKVKHGNGKTITYAYDNFYNTLKAISYNTGHTYDIDIEAASGNVRSRTNWYTSAADKKTETFEYDTYDRLTFIKRGTTIDMEMRYADNGNITYKSDVGTYIYSTTQPHAVVKTTPIAATGQTLIDLSQYQNVSYGAFNKIEEISQSQSQAAPTPSTELKNAFTYGADEQRLTMSQGTTTKVYDDGYEAILDASGNVLKEWTYIFGPDGNLNAFQLGGSSPPLGEGLGVGLYFTVCDHLGSPSLIANATGTVVEKLSFDAWGRRRNADTWVALNNGAFAGLLGARGFTFHEHLDEYGLINMNGRLYDPVLARMIQADAVIPDRLDTQSYNAYSYVFNNPLKYTDADGNCPVCIAILIGVAIGAATNIIQQGIASNWTFENFDWGSLIADALIGGVSGAVTFGIGEAFKVASFGAKAASWVGKEAARALAHGVAQSYIYVFSSAIKGEDVSLSNFAITFVTAGLASAASSGLKVIGAAANTQAISQFANSLGGQMAFGGLVGGVTSAALGGNFWEGLATGAIVSGLNHGLHKMADGNKQTKSSLGIRDKDDRQTQIEKALKMSEGDYMDGKDLDFIDSRASVGIKRITYKGNGAFDVEPTWKAKASFMVKNDASITITKSNMIIGGKNVSGYNVKTTGISSIIIKPETFFYKNKIYFFQNSKLMNYEE